MVYVKPSRPPRVVTRLGPRAEPGNAQSAAQIAARASVNARAGAVRRVRPLEGGSAEEPS